MHSVQLELVLHGRLIPLSHGRCTKELNYSDTETPTLAFEVPDSWNKIRFKKKKGEIMMIIIIKIIIIWPLFTQNTDDKEKNNNKRTRSGSTAAPPLPEARTQNGFWSAPSGGS